MTTPFWLLIIDSAVLFRNLSLMNIVYIRVDGLVQINFAKVVCTFSYDTIRKKKFTTLHINVNNSVSVFGKEKIKARLTSLLYGPERGSYSLVFFPLLSWLTLTV